MYNSNEVEAMLREYYLIQGYKVYTIEMWFECCLSPEGNIFVDIECGGDSKKYFHIHGYQSNASVQRILDNINLKLGVDVCKKEW